MQIINTKVLNATHCASRWMRLLIIFSSNFAKWLYICPESSARRGFRIFFFPIQIHAIHVCFGCFNVSNAGCKVILSRLRKAMFEVCRFCVLWNGKKSWLSVRLKGQQTLKLRKKKQTAMSMIELAKEMNKTLKSHTKIKREKIAYVQSMRAHGTKN